MPKLKTSLANIRRFHQHRFFNDGWVVGLSLMAVLTNIVTAVWSLLRIKQSDVLVPVRYTSLNNFDVLGHWYQLYYIVALSVIILIVNMSLAIISYKRSRLISIFLMLVAVMAAVWAAAIVFGFTAINYGT